MNNYFYFNECIGNGYDKQSLCSALENIIIQFSKFRNRSDDILIFEKESNKIKLSDFPLNDIIQASKNKDYRKLIYSYLKNYPIGSFIESHQNVDEEILNEEYKFLTQDATNLAIASMCDWIAFSIPISVNLKVDKIKLRGKTKSLSLANFYGDNVEFVKNSINDLKSKKASGPERLKLLANDVVISCEFEKYFEDIPILHQNLIIERFEEAKKNQYILAEKIKSNDNVVKHVRTRVGELRILTPVQIRVYFHSIGPDKLIIASLNYKSKYKNTSDQNKDIESAGKKIDEILNQ